MTDDIRTDPDANHADQPTHAGGKAGRVDIGRTDRDTRWIRKSATVEPVEPASDSTSDQKEERGGLYLASLAAMLLPLLIVLGLVISKTTANTELELADVSETTTTTTTTTALAESPIELSQSSELSQRPDDLLPDTFEPEPEPESAVSIAPDVAGAIEVVEPSVAEISIGDPYEVGVAGDLDAATADQKAVDTVADGISRAQPTPERRPATAPAIASSEPTVEEISPRSPTTSAPEWAAPPTTRPHATTTKAPPRTTTPTITTPTITFPSATTPTITTPTITFPSATTPTITTPTTSAPTTTSPPPRTAVSARTNLSLTRPIQIGQLGDRFVRLSFTSNSTTSYRVAVLGQGRVTATRSGTAVANQSVGVSIDGLTPGTAYNIQVILDGPPEFRSSPVAIQTSGGNPIAVTEDVRLLDLRVVEAQRTRIELNYESNICANGSFVIRSMNGAVVGRNDGQASGCTTQHLAIPGFWTNGLQPNTDYQITVTVEAGGAGRGNGNTASQTMTIRTSP